MKRHKKEEKEKFLRRTAKKSREVWRQARELRWEPVDEPQFIGWEVWLELGESGKRRRDAEDILLVMNLLNIGKVIFTRHERISKIIKAARNRYDDVLRLFSKVYASRYFRNMYRYGSWSDYLQGYLPHWHDNQISDEKWKSLPANIRGYFDKHVEKATVWRDAYDYYKLNRQRFPVYELTLKCVKAYSTHRGIPNSEAQKEYDYLEDVLDREGYYRKNRGDGWWNHKVQSVCRKAWNTETSILVKEVDAKNLEEVEPNTKRLTRRTNFDWSL